MCVIGRVMALMWRPEDNFGVNFLLPLTFYMGSGESNSGPRRYSSRHLYSLDPILSSKNKNGISSKR